MGCAAGLGVTDSITFLKVKLMASTRSYSVWPSTLNSQKSYVEREIKAPFTAYLSTVKVALGNPGL